jgi:hypothetical protein
MNDLEIAKSLLSKKRLTLVIVKNGKTLFETQFHRISGFLKAIEQEGKNLHDASVADRVVGKAVALLCVYAKVKEVYAETLSVEGKNALQQNGIAIEAKELVNTILDDRKKDLCPYEKEAANVNKPQAAFDRFKALQKKMQACR